jgi:hypothetical protein
MNLGYAQQDYGWDVANIFSQHKTANIQAASQRKAKPSAGGLVLGLGQAVLGGVSAGMSLKAPSGFGKGNVPGANDLGSVAQANNIQVKPGYYGPAF